MTSPWEDLVTAATLGTDRRPLDVSAWPGRFGELARALPGAGPGLLLDAAALGATYRRAGSRPAPSAASAAPEAPEPVREEVPAAAAERLRDLLSGGPATLLAEWLQLAATTGRRAPAAMLPALLDLAVVRPELAGPVAAVLDLPGAWLAGFRSDWTRAVAGASTALEGPPPDDWWTHGSTDQRVAWLHAAREADPAAARAALQRVWDRERADERARFLAVLAPAVDADDEDLLEHALDDRSAAVRRQAAALLARLPASDFVRRWRERLAGWARVERPALRGPRLRVDLRHAPDVPARDLALAVVARAAAGGTADDALTVLTAVPATAWEAVRPDVSALVALPVTGVDGEVLHRGLAHAAARDHHLGLTRALLDAGEHADDLLALLALLPAPERAHRAVAVVGRDAGSPAAVTALEACPAPWPGTLAVAATALVARTRADPAGGGRARRLLELLAHRADARQPGALVALRGLAEQLPATSPLLPAAHAALTTLVVRARMHMEMQDGTHEETHTGTTTDRGDR